MPRFIIQCQITYTRTVQLGVEADSETHALDLLDREKAEDLFTDDRPVLLDEYNQDVEGLFPIMTSTVDALEDGEPWPKPDSSIQERDEQAAQTEGARRVCRLLIAADASTKAGDGAPDWDAFNIALDAARDVLSADEVEAIEKRYGVHDESNLLG